VNRFISAEVDFDNKIDKQEKRHWPTDH